MLTTSGEEETVVMASAAELERFHAACDRALPRPRSFAVTQWLDSLKQHQPEEEDKAATPPSKKKQVVSLPVAVVLSLLGCGVALAIGLVLLPQLLVSVIYLAVGLLAGIWGVCRRQQEFAALGGILTKSLAWYLAPTLTSLGQGEKFALSVALAGFLEYPFLTYANTLGFKTRTGMRLRAFQDFTDVLASFVLIAVEGSGGTVDAFSISQTVLALVRVGIAFADPKNRRRRSQAGTAETAGAVDDVEAALVMQDVGGKLAGIPKPVLSELGPERFTAPTPAPAAPQKRRMTRRRWLELGMCVSFAVAGVVLGVVGMVVPFSDIMSSAYVLGIAAMLGMSLAWYIGPSMRNQRFVTKWAVAMVFMSALEYPFLTEANTRAAQAHALFELRAVQDVVSMLVSTIMIRVLGQVPLNGYDYAQLFVGFLRVLVATRFFFAI